MPSDDAVLKDVESEECIQVPYNQILLNKNSPSSGDALELKIEYLLEANPGTTESRNARDQGTCTSQSEIHEKQEDKRQWQYQETLALIAAVENRYEEMHHPKKRKVFWDTISEELSSSDVHVDAARCKKKWDNLVMTYKKTKHIKMKTGRSTTRFVFFQRLDDLLSDPPNNCSAHTLDIGNESFVAQLPAPSTRVNKKKTAPFPNNTQMPQNHYIERTKALNEYRRKKLELYERRLALEEKRLALEERKVIALELLSNTNAEQ